MSEATAGKPQSNQRASKYGSALLPEEHIFKWQKRGHPWMLLLEVGGLVGRQYFTLGLILAAVFFNPFESPADRHKNTHRFLLSCNPYKIGWRSAYVCEVTKTGVRFFPLLGLIVLQLIGGHMLAHQRAFYLLLRQGVMIKFENRNPLADTVLWVLSVLATLAVLHYVHWFYLEYMYPAPATLINAGRHANERALLENVKSVVLLYFVPMGLFLFALYSSYNFTEMMLPVNKYWDEDPEWARQQSAEMTIFEEETLAETIWSHRDREELRQLVGAQSRDSLHGFIGAMSSFTPTSEDQPQWTRAKDLTLIYGMWSSRLLLDRALVPREMARFKAVWVIYVSVSTIVFVVAFGFLIYQTNDDVGDVFKDGHKTDMTPVAIELSLCVLMGHLALGFLAVCGEDLREG